MSIISHSLSSHFVQSFFIILVTSVCVCLVIENEYEERTIFTVIQIIKSKNQFDSSFLKKKKTKLMKKSVVRNRKRDLKRNKRKCPTIPLKSGHSVRNQNWLEVLSIRFIQLNKTHTLIYLSIVSSSNQSPFIAWLRKRLQPKIK